MSEEDMFETGILEVWSSWKINKNEIDELLKNAVFEALQEDGIITSSNKCDIEINESDFEWNSNVPKEGEYNGRLSIVKKGVHNWTRWVVERAQFSFDVNKYKSEAPDEIETSYLSVIFGKNAIKQLQDRC